MKPLELFNLCMAAIDRFNNGEVYADKPFVYLTVPREKCPKGRSIRLFGGSGPNGEICNIKRRDGLFDVVALFPAVPIVDALAEHVGANVKFSRAAITKATEIERG